MKYTYLLIALLLSTLAVIKTVETVYHFEQVTFPNTQNKSSGNRILIVNSAHGILGGAELYSVTLYNNLVKNGHSVKFLIPKNSELEKKLTELKISYYTYNKFVLLKSQIQPGLYSAIYKICEQDKIQIVHCNIHREVNPAKKVARKLPIKVVMTRHIPQEIGSTYLKNLDGVICVS